jgi:hypothetical protein
MTKVITALIIIVALYIGWELFLYWDKVKNEEEAEKKKAKAAEIVVPEQLAGMPYQLETSLQAAQKQGATGLKNWLKAYGPSIQDPRKAWIELDYCVAVSKDNPAEAKRVFAEVKARTPESSPIYSRIKKLQEAYE